MPGGTAATRGSTTDWTRGTSGFRREKDDYDLFLGRLHRAKGYRLAVEGAKRTRRRLLVAGGWRPSLSRWVRYIGKVGGDRKAALLAGARVLWMPAQWEEPCGNTILEALVSGTPVLGTRRGLASRDHLARGRGAGRHAWTSW